MADISAPPAGFSAPPVIPATPPAPVPAAAVPPVAPPTPQAPPHNPYAPPTPATPPTGAPVPPTPAAPPDPVAAALAAGLAPITPAQPTTPAAAPVHDGPLSSIDPNTLENPQLRALGGLLKTTFPNLDVDRALGNALTYSNPDLIDTAYLGEIGGKNAEQLVQVARNIVEAQAAETQASQAAVFDLAKGEQNWNQAVAAFNAKATPELRKVVVGLLDSPNRSAITQGAQFLLDFARQNGAISTPASTLDAAAGGPAAAQVTGLTKAQFQDAHRHLDQNAPDYAEKRDQLFHLRKVGKSRGI